MTPLSTPDDIEQELAALRSVLKHDVREFASEARDLIDWRCHFRAHPWLCCGGVAALGWLLVPRRERTQRVEVAVVTHTDEDQKVVLRPRGAAAVGESLLKTIFKLAATTVATEALDYLVRRVRRDPQ